MSEPQTFLDILLLFLVLPLLIGMDYVVHVRLCSYISLYYVTVYVSHHIS